MQKPQIVINHIRYTIPNSPIQFQDVCLSFDQKRYGIVGDNGVGKTTLLKLISKQLTPEQGTIQLHGSVSYCPQHYRSLNPSETIADLLGINHKLQALKRIAQGVVSEDDFELIGDDWDLESKIRSVFDNLQLTGIALDRPIISLSGGQKTKCLLAKVMLSTESFLLLDEPTNNLDADSRAFLYQWVQETHQGVLIVCHDRTLLDQMHEIVELTTKGIHNYGGNYRFYEQQKAIYQEALEHKLSDAERKIDSVGRSVQATKEKHERRAKKGRALRKAGRIDKLTANSMKGRSERTRSRNNTQAEKMLTDAKDIANEARAKMEYKEEIQVELNATRVPQGKLVLQIEKLAFEFEPGDALFNHFDLQMFGPERIAILGKNGCGKTTLVKLIRGELSPNKGRIVIGVSHICYLDQQVSFLKPALNLVENFQALNPHASVQDSYSALASFNFRNKQAEKKVAALSGGERIRAGLAISLLSTKPPQLIILDEPTNHLDIRSIKSIENSLSVYKGALMVISHDTSFIENLNISRVISLNKTSR